jgi:hypothetical protein
MSNDVLKSISVAEKVVSFAMDGTRSLDRAMVAWPAEFRALIWDAVAAIATARAAEARADVSSPGEPNG